MIEKVDIHVYLSRLLTLSVFGMLAEIIELDEICSKIIIVLSRDWSYHLTVDTFHVGRVFSMDWVWGQIGFGFRPNGLVILGKKKITLGIQNVKFGQMRPSVKFD